MAAISSGTASSGRVWSLGLTVDADTGQAMVVDETEHTDEFGGTTRGLAPATVF
ncbi:MAG: hypothetical protein IT177_02890 [Acidobacteria bacterium]|nr:hypothetical protein [Acidobacteriota bacterium]